MDDVRFSNSIDEMHIFQAISKSDLNIGMHIFIEASASMPKEMKGRINIAEPIQVKSPADLSARLETIAEAYTRVSHYPLFHFDFHADSTKGLYFPESDTYLSWDKFADSCRKINYACANNLTVILGACWGFHALLPLDFKKRSPYSILIGFDKAMSNQEVEDDLLDFYRTFFTTLDLSSSLRNASNSFQEYAAEHFLIQTLIRYHIMNCNQKTIQDRTDMILSQSALLNPHVKSNLSELRKMIKQGLKKMNVASVKAHYDRFLCADDLRNYHRYDLSLWNDLVEESRLTAKPGELISIKISRS